MLRFEVHAHGKRVVTLSGTIKMDSSVKFGMSGLNQFSLSYQLGEVGVAEEYPAATLDSITVEKKLRRNGWGSLALSIFEFRAADAGCKFCCCHVGYKDTVQNMIENCLFYERNGWKIFSHNLGKLPKVGIPKVFSTCTAYKSLQEGALLPSLPPGATIVETREHSKAGDYLDHLFCDDGHIQLSSADEEDTEK